MPLSCVSVPALTEEEALEAKFFDARSHRRGGSSSADMSPSYADESASVAFDTPDGMYALAKRWTHPDGPRPFHPRCSPRAVVAQVPGTKKHRCLLVNAGDALVVHNFNPFAETASNGASASLASPPPIRVLTFPGTTVTAVAHREIAGDAIGAPDVLIGLGTGEVLLVSLRALIADRDGKALPPGTRRFNTDGGGGTGASARVVRDVLSSGGASKTAARCTSVAWFAPKKKNRPPDDDANDDASERGVVFRATDLFLSTHADGNAYVYSAALGDGVDPRFAELRGSNAAEAISLTPAPGVRGEQYAGEPEKTPNPFARMRVGPAALTAAAVAPGGEAVALAGADGQVSVLDVRRVATGDVFLVDGFKSHFGGVDALAWAEGPRDDDDDDDDDDDASETTPNALLGRFRADVCADSPATPRFLLAGGEADVVEVWDRPRRALAARARGHASWVARVAETPRFAFGRRRAKKKKKNARDGDGETTTTAAMFRADDDAPGEKTSHGKKTSLLHADHRYDDLLADAGAPRRLRFASAGQDCRVCFWELDVDPAPKWWVPVPVFDKFDTTPDPERHPFGEGFTTSANVDVPAGRAGTATREAESEGVLSHENENLSGAGDANDANDEAPPSVPPRARLGRASNDSAAAGETESPKSPSVPVRPEPALGGASLMFPTLREDSTTLSLRGGATLSTLSLAEADSKALPAAVSRADVFGDGRLIARAASSINTPCIAPAASHVAHDEPCTGLALVDEGILTCCGGGVVKLWRRTEER